MSLLSPMRLVTLSFAAIALLAAMAPSASDASSHREAPFIPSEPRAEGKRRPSSQKLRDQARQLRHAECQRAAPAGRPRRAERLQDGSQGAR